MAKFTTDNPYVVFFTWPGKEDEKVIKWVHKCSHDYTHYLGGLKMEDVSPLYLPGQRRLIVIINSPERTKVDETKVKLFVKRFVKNSDIKAEICQAIQWTEIQDYIKPDPDPKV